MELTFHILHFISGWTPNPLITLPSKEQPGSLPANYPYVHYFLPLRPQGKHCDF